MVPHQSCSIVYSKKHLSIHMFGPHACSGYLRGLATCVIIGELAHLWGRMDYHHFDQQQERGCTTKVDYSWSILRSILVRCLSGPLTESVCVGGGAATSHFAM